MIDIRVAEALTTASEVAPRSPWAIAWSNLRRDRVAMAGALVIVLLMLAAAFAPLLNDWYGQNPNTLHPDLIRSDTLMPVGPWGGMSQTHWLGVEPTFGQDILANIIAGARTSLVIGLVATAMSISIGVVVALVAGYYGGWIDVVVCAVIDTLLAFPVLLFALAVLAILGPADSLLGLSGQSMRFLLIVGVLGLFSWPYTARLNRGYVLAIRERDYVAAARCLGATDRRIIFREVLPNLAGPILVDATISIPQYILGEASLSFLGVGFTPPTSSWGQMISRGADTADIDPGFILWPGLALFICVFAFNVFGDGLRDCLDPRSLA